MTGTFGGLTPVTKLDGRIIGSGKTGEFTKQLRELYNELIHAEILSS